MSFEYDHILGFFGGVLEHSLWCLFVAVLWNQSCDNCTGLLWDMPSFTQQRRGATSVTAWFLGVHDSV